MSQTKLKRAKPPLPRRQPEWARVVLRQPKGINALHESSHGVVHALLDTPGFESVDIKTRTRETHPNAGIPAGFMSLGFTKVVWPGTITRGCAWSRVLGLLAPGITSQILGYRDDGHRGGDERELGIIAHDLEVDPNELLKRASLLTADLVNNAAVVAAIFNTAVALLDRVELSAGEVRRLVLDTQAEPPGWPIVLSEEVQGLISITELIHDHDRMVAKLVAQRH
jgi:hypothetical protein